MKFGCCAPILDAGAVQDAGFDYLECTVVSLDPEGAEEEFSRLEKRFKTSPLPVEVFNVFLPGDLRIVGDGVDQARIKRYLQTSLQRVAGIGADVVVFGSGRARNRPEGYSMSQAEDQIVWFLNEAADVAERLGITIVIEPLNRRESNTINSIPQAVSFVKKVDRDPIKALADLYHIDEDNEPLEHVSQCSEFIYHVHVADTNRRAPGSGSYPYLEFAAKIKQAPHVTRVSVECQWGDFAQEAPVAVRFLQQHFR